jgi:SAM-dependent methyltransferase
MKRIKICPVCNSKSDLLKLFSYKDRDSIHANINLCIECRSLIPEYELDIDYTKLENQTEFMNFALTLNEENAKSLVEGYLGVIDFYSEYLEEVRSEGRICEVGFGRGSLIMGLKERGFDIIGCDPSKYLVQQAKSIYNLQDTEIRNTDLEGLEKYINNENIPISACIMWHVLEHIPNSLSVFKTINRMLKKNGYFIFQIPLLQISQLHPDHLAFFTEASIDYLVKRTGFKVIRKDYDFERLFLSVIVQKQR